MSSSGGRNVATTNGGSKTSEKETEVEGNMPTYFNLWQKPDFFL